MNHARRCAAASISVAQRTLLCQRSLSGPSHRWRRPAEPDLSAPYGVAWVSNKQRRQGIFGPLAEEYEQFRPYYPQALYNDLVLLTAQPNDADRASARSPRDEQRARAAMTDADTAVDITEDVTDRHKSTLDEQRTRAAMTDADTAADIGGQGATLAGAGRRREHGDATEDATAAAPSDTTEQRTRAAMTDADTAADISEDVNLMPEQIMETEKSGKGGKRGAATTKPDTGRMAGHDPDPEVHPNPNRAAPAGVRQESSLGGEPRTPSEQLHSTPPPASAGGGGPLGGSSATPAEPAKLHAATRDTDMSAKSDMAQLSEDLVLAQGAESRGLASTGIDKLSGGATPEAPARGLRIVDLGCGTGRGARALAALGAHVDAVDVDADMLRVLDSAVKKEGLQERVRAVQANAEHTALPSGGYDAACCLQAWHWLDATPARRELARLLRPGGMAVVAWCDRDLDSPLVSAFEDLIERHNPAYLRHLRQSEQWAPSVRASPEQLPLVATGQYRHSLRLADADALVRLAMTYTCVRFALDDKGREAFATDCRALARDAAGGDGAFDLPLITKAHFLRRSSEPMES